ncbi:MAG TPA: SsrA-binding protein SmpB [Spirochaetota bacterium]|nr:SsrA-binding protein SmpB [Spirochaetota bacterium]HPC39397.1 SsrA-binding protein SmpB [Spirochaetota bacterium]HPL16884.1 SsrA-binding protein SmpB [Spirochaetota bacterium]HQF06734.1 SsrA-binding protein SmpB [Spirochaetota bacterium]HQH95647.1 SsrA-binding protein SmpB [Spirochaetota bacterium]
MADSYIEIARNKKARFDYEIIETFEAGIVLVGSEVKSLRQKKASIQESYARVKDGEIYITGMNIAVYEMANRFNHEPVHDRKLLLHRHEIKRLIGKVQEKGLTLVPLKLYFKNGKVKVELGLAKGKAKYDKRDSIKKRDVDREIQREWKNYR